MKSEEWIVSELEQLRQAGLERRLRVNDIPVNQTDSTCPIMNFAGNDYLDLCHNQLVIQAAHQAATRWGAGSGASRLVSGTLPIHNTLEKRLAKLKHYPAALLFGSGYMANVGIITAMVGRNDWLVTDRLAHASIIDAAILSRASLHRFRHNDLQHLEEILRRRPAGARCLVVTESVFSMDGDCAPLTEIAALTAQYDAMLMVDEAHATGIFGERGAGLVNKLGLEQSVNIAMGTLSKALGAYGGFCACSHNIRNLLTNRARALIFSTAPPPAAMGAALGALDYLERYPYAGRELLQRANLFRARLESAGLDTGNSTSQIVPLIIGDNRRALHLAAALRAQGIFAPAIRPPTVPNGTARIRFSISLAHTPEQLEKAAGIIIEQITPRIQGGHEWGAGNGEVVRSFVGM